MLRRAVVLAGLAGSIVSIATGCGTRTLDIGIFPSATTTDAGDAQQDSPGVNVPGPSQTIVVSYFRIGLTTRDGTASDDAWKDYGFDLDGVCTTAADSKTSDNTCQRAPSSKDDVLTDGDDCIDNNFGSQLVTFIREIQPTAEDTLASGIKGGGVTLALRIDDLAPSGADASAPGALFASKVEGSAAKLDGTDVFDVDSSSVEGGDLSKPVATLTGSVSIVGGARTWSGRADLLALPAVFIAGASGTIPIRDARIDVDLDTMRGTVGGFAMLADVQTVVGLLLANQGVCPGNAIYDTVTATVSQSVDMPEALPQDTTKACVALSIGLGLEVVNATLGKTYPTPTPAPDPCATP